MAAVLERRQRGIGPGVMQEMQRFAQAPGALPPTGQALEKQLVPMAEEVNQISVQGIPDKTVAVVRNALLSIIENLAADEADKEEGGDRARP